MLHAAHTQGSDIRYTCDYFKAIHTIHTIHTYDILKLYIRSDIRHTCGDFKAIGFILRVAWHQVKCEHKAAGGCNNKDTRREQLRKTFTIPVTTASLNLSEIDPDLDTVFGIQYNKLHLIFLKWSHAQLRARTYSVCSSGHAYACAPSIHSRHNTKECACSRDLLPSHTVAGTHGTAVHKAA